MVGHNDSYSNTEHTPLIGGHPRSSKRWSVTHVLLLCLCTVAILFSAKAAIDIEVIQARSEMDRLTPALDRLRHEYTEELVKQQALRQSWSDRLEEMRVETAKEQKKQDVMRQAWHEEIARQREETDKEVERLRRETDEELERQEQVRRRWREETDRHDTECRQRAEERVREEERRDAEERLNMHLFWDGPHPAEHCWSYGTREYSGRLWNIASGYNWTRACEMTPAVINGNSIATPSWCQIPNVFSGVVGHWLLSHGEKDCEPAWGKFFDKGCSGNGKRLIESRLWGVQKGEDAYNLCKTAPVTYKGIRYDTPTYCFERERDKAMIATSGNHPYPGPSP